MNALDRVARAREMIGVKFLHLGKGKFGIDCVGLIVYAHDHPVEQTPSYPRDPYNNQLELNLDRFLGTPIAVYDRGCKVSDLQSGDTVAMAYAKQIRHVAIIAKHPSYPDQLSIIHTDSHVGRVTEHILDKKWLRRIRRVYRV